MRGVFVPLVLMFGCSSPDPATSTQPPPDAGSSAAEPSAGAAEVIGVSVQGDPGAYDFSVTLRSPDTGCSRYADWWEVLDEDGGLLYRRILAHSHVDEQPFTRSGGPVAAQPGQTVIVRAHMNDSGYGTVVMRGTPDASFETQEIERSFGAAAEQQPPLPDGCAF